MKRAAIIFAAIFGLALSSVAENVEPVFATNAQIVFNGFNMFQVTALHADTDKLEVSIYAPNDELIQRYQFGGGTSMVFNMAQLPDGDYRVVLTKNDEEILSKTIQKGLQ